MTGMKNIKTIIIIATSAFICLALFGCPSNNQPSNGNSQPASNGNSANGVEDTGVPDEPVRIAFVPSVEQGQIELSLEEFDTKLAELIDHEVESDIVLSYTACIEQMAAGHFDVALLPAFAYVLAHDRYDIEVRLKAVRDGKASYRGEIITRTDSGIDTLEDLRGRTFGFTEASSASGYLYPKTFLISQGINPDTDLAEYLFIGNHPMVVEAVFQGRVDAGACFDDARLRLIDTEPQVMEQVKVIAYTPEIPSDTVSFRAGLEGPFWDRVTDALIEMSHEGEEGALYRIYDIEELVPAQNSDYDPIRQMVETLNYDIESELD
jgi:phosphonate transport system substrate-binding protein